MEAGFDNGSKFNIKVPKHLESLFRGSYFYKEKDNLRTRLNSPLKDVKMNAVIEYLELPEYKNQ